jgi:hypothetical protein
MTAKHKSTQKNRTQVEEMAGYGLPHEQIGAIIGIDDKTLRKYYRIELDRGKASANAKVVKSLFHKATEDKDTTAMIWWTKAQMGWSEKQNEIESEAPPVAINFMVNPAVSEVKVTNAKGRQESKMIEKPN